MTSHIDFYVSDSIRKNTIKKLKNFFEDNDICTAIEQGCYDATEQYCSDTPSKKAMSNGIYKHTVNDILYNLKSNNETIQSLTENINNGTMDPTALAYLKYHQMNENLWKSIKERHRITKEKLNNLPTVTRDKPCRGCGENEFFFYQIQTRSADEPITTYYICKHCDHTYKVNR